MGLFVGSAGVEVAGGEAMGGWRVARGLRVAMMRRLRVARALRVSRAICWLFIGGEGAKVVGGKGFRVVRATAFLSAAPVFRGAPVTPSVVVPRG